MTRARSGASLAALLVLASVAPLGPSAPSPAPAAPTPARGISAAIAVTTAVDAARARARVVADRRRRERARQAEARRLRRSRTVRGALRRAWLARAISRRRYEQLRHRWWRAQRDAAKLTGTRRAELTAVLRMTERLAAAHKLTASRLDPVFLTIARNRSFWMSRPLPKPNARMTFPGDPVVFQYYAGRGLAIQPLASFGKANALVGACVRTNAPHTCRPAALRKLLDRMLALGSQRGGFLAWEYFFAFGGGTPPWISAMTQATGAQALARGERALGDARYAQAAKRALGAFEVRPPTGVAVRSGSAARYTMYSFAPGLRILNGELQALIGLRDVARITGSTRAAHLFARAEPAARRMVRGFDTGAWSLYSAGGKESTLSYHRLVAGFLAGLCRRTSRATYCSAGKRFARYVREPPRVRDVTPRKVRARKRTTIHFTLSKISDVMLQVRDRRGRLEFAKGLRGLPHGRHAIAWTPKLVGRHQLRIVAIGPAGKRAVERRTLQARAVRRAPDRKRKAAAKPASGSTRS